MTPPGRGDARRALLALGALLAIALTLLTAAPPSRAARREPQPPLSTASSHVRPDVARSGEPPTARGPLLWTVPVGVDVSPIDGIACPSRRLCVAVDRSGGVLWSTDPAGGARAWHLEDIDGAVELTGVSCPSTRLCVAVDALGRVLSSAQPAGDGWSVATVDTNAGQNNTDTGGAVLMRGISCPSTALCVAVDAVGDAFVSADPLAGTAAWTPIHADANATYGCAGTGLVCQPPLVGISCPSTTLCDAIDFSGNILATDAPTAPAAWGSTPTAPHGLGSLWGISCPTTTFCAAVDGPGQRVTTFNPSLPSARVTRTLPEAVDGIWCASRSLCLASAETGGGISGLLASTNPAAARPTWTLGTLGGVNAVGCPSPSMCVAVDDEGNIAAGERTAAVAATLRTQLLSRRPPARSALAGGAIDRLRFTSAIAGRVQLAWTQAKGGTTTTVASTSHRFAVPGTATLKLRLTRAGRRIFRGSARRVTLTATATYVASNGQLLRSRRLTFTRPARRVKRRGRAAA